MSSLAWQARLESLESENAKLREQIEHMTILLSKPQPLHSSAATSPLKLAKSAANLPNLCSPRKFNG